MPFFNGDTIYKKYPYFKTADILAICGPRNIGKSTATYKGLIKNKYFTPEKKVLIMRNTQKELERAIPDFIERFKNKLTVSRNFIYTLKKAVIKKDGEEITIYVKDKHVGYFSAVNTYLNDKSSEAPNVAFIFYEEFNEDTAIGKNIYPKFINLIGTYIRFHKTKIVMLGNKDGFISDFYVNGNIIPQNQTEEDVIFEIPNSGYWLELGEKNFRDLKNNETLAYRLAMLDNRTAAYAQGGYLQGISSLVKNYKELLPHFKLLYYFAVDEYKYSFGRYQDQYAIISPGNAPKYDAKYKTYSVDLISRLLKESDILDAEDLEDIIKQVLTLIKQEHLYFDSYDTLQRFKDLTIGLKKI